MNDEDRPAYLRTVARALRGVWTMLTLRRRVERLLPDLHPPTESEHQQILASLRRFLHVKRDET